MNKYGKQYSLHTDQVTNKNDIKIFYNNGKSQYKYVCYNNNFSNTCLPSLYCPNAECDNILISPAPPKIYYNKQNIRKLHYH